MHRRKRRALLAESLEQRVLLTQVFPLEINQPFQYARLETGTPLPEFNSDQYQLTLADWDVDGQEDLFAIKRFGTASGKVEVLIYSGASDFQTKIATKVMDLNTSLVTSDWTFRVYNSNAAASPDIAAFDPDNGTGHVNVYIFSGSQNYSIKNTYVTSLNAGAHWHFDMADFDGDDVQDAYAIEINADHTATVTILSGVNGGTGKYKTQLYSAPLNGNDKTFEDSFEFRVRQWGPGDAVPDIIAIKRYGPDEFGEEGFTFIWDYGGITHPDNDSAPYTWMRAAVPARLLNTPGNFYQWDIRDVQGSTTTHDGFTDLVLFSTYQTGSSSSEVHIYTGEYLPSINYLQIGLETVEEDQTMQSGQVAWVSGEKVVFLGAIRGPRGTELVFKKGDFEVVLVSVGQLAVGEAKLQLVEGGKITALEGMTVNTGDVALTITINGTVDTPVVDFRTGTLNGTSIINGNLTAGFPTSTDTLAILAPGNSPGRMSVQSLVLHPSVNVEEQIFGTAAGTEYDQIVASGSVTLNSPRLILDVQASVPAGAEFVVIRNDGSEAVLGNFANEFGTVLQEGSIVSTDFGGSGRTARISYRGGDGNDVVIVVDGDYTFVSPANVGANSLRVVNDNGVVQFFVENVLTRARLSAGLSQLIVQGETGQVDNVRVDFTNGNPIPAGGILLSTGTDSNDMLTILGSSVDSVTQTLVDSQLSTIAVKTGTTTTNISYSKLALVTDELTAATRSFVMSAQAEIASFTDSGTAAVTRLTASNGRTIDFANPSSVLKLTLGSGIDNVTVTSLGSGFAGALDLRTGTGADVLTMSPNLTTLSTLTLVAATINLNAGALTTSGAQTYTGKVTVGTDLVLAGTNLSFSSTINGSASGKTLTLNTTTNGVTSLLGAVGNVVPLAQLTTNADGTTLLKGNVTVTGNAIQFGEAVTLQANSIIQNTTGSVAFGKTINGAFAATVSADSNATFSAAVIGLTSLQVTAPNIVLNGSGITTTGAQTYSGAVKVGVDQTLAGASLTFNSTLDAGVADVDLILNSASGGATSFQGSIGSVLPLKSLTTNADGSTLLKGNISGAASTLNFNDGVTLQSNVSLTDSGVGAMNFASTLDGAFKLLLSSAGSVVFGGLVGATVPLGTTTGPAIEIASTGTTRFAKAMTVVSHLVQQATAGVVTFQEDVTITAATTDTEFNGNVVLDGLKLTSNRGFRFGDAASDQVQLTTSDTTFDIASGLAMMNALITGIPGLIKTGLGSMALNTGNTYQGTTTLLAGTMTRAVANALPVTTYLTLGAGTSFSLQTFDAAIAGIAGTGNLALEAQTLTLSGSGIVSYAGVISGAGRVVKSGTGIQSLSGNNTYAGTTDVRGGELIVTGKIGASAVAGDVTVRASATLTASSVINARVAGVANSVINVSTAAVLGLATHLTGFSTLGVLNIGDGTVQLLDVNTITVGPLTTIAGGTLKVARAFSFGTGSTLSGNGAIIATSGTMGFVGTTLNVGGAQSSTLSLPAFSMDATSTLGIEVGLHKIIANGAVTINKPVLNSTLISNAVPGQDYVVIDNDGTDPIVGIFKDLAQGAQVSYGPARFARTLYYSNVVAVGNDFVVRPIKFVATTTSSIDSTGINYGGNVDLSGNSSGQVVSLFTYPQSSEHNFRLRLFGPQGTKTREFFLDGALSPAGNWETFDTGKPFMRENGDFVIAVNGTWDDVHGVRLYYFNSLGQFVNRSSVVASNSSFELLSMSMTGDGSSVVTWQETSNDGSKTRIVFARFNADLSAVTATPVAVTSYSSKIIQNFSVRHNESGDFVIGWSERILLNLPEAHWRDLALRYAGDGTVIDATPLVIASKSESLVRMSDGLAIGMRTDRGLVHAYYSLTGSGLGNTIVRRVNPNGSLHSEQVITPAGMFSYGGTGLALGMNEFDEYVVASDAGLENFEQWNQYVQKFSSNDVPITLPVSVGSYNSYGVGTTIVDLHKDGSFTLMWGRASLSSSPEVVTTSYGEPQDAVASSLILSPATTLQLKYDLRSGNAGPLKLKFYKSADRYVDAADQVLATLSLTATADLSKGSHSKTFTVGSGSGQVPIPGSGLPATTDDYYLLAMLDPDDQMFELDQEPIAFDNQTRLYFHFNHAPVISGLSAERTYVENAVAVNVAPSAVVADIDTALPEFVNFAGGSLKLTLTSNATSNDRIEVVNQGTGAGQIGRSGNTLTFGGVAYGTVAGGVGTTALTVSLNSAATPAFVQALLRAITFRTLGDTPSALPRTLWIELNDGDGATGVATTTLRVTAVNDAPVLGGVGRSKSYTKNVATGVVLASAATLSDADHSVWTGGKLTVRVSTGAGASNRIFVGTGFSVDSLNTVFSGTLAIGTLNVGGGTGTKEFLITFNSKATTAIVTSLIRSLRFKTVSGAAGDRRVHFKVTDPAGGLSTELNVLVKVT